MSSEIQGFFIAGTDTGVGKTVVTTGLMARARQQGWNVSGMKPVASGAVKTADGLRNDDALAIQAQCSVPLPYSIVNPCVYQAAASPNIAAAAEGKSIKLADLAPAWQQFPAEGLRFVEGVGGWKVPLGESLNMTDLAIHLGLPVILVVGIRLGCINHALLSADAICQSGLPLVGWVANEIDPEMEYKSQVINELQDSLDAPLLGQIPNYADISAQMAADYLQISSFKALLV